MKYFPSIEKNRAYFFITGYLHLHLGVKVKSFLNEDPLQSYTYVNNDIFILVIKSLPNAYYVF